MPGYCHSVHVVDRQPTWVGETTVIAVPVWCYLCLVDFPTRTGFLTRHDRTIWRWRARATGKWVWHSYINNPMIFLQAVVDRPYNTRSGVAPLPSTKATRVPLVRGPPTERYARFRTKCTKRDGTFDEAKAYRRETSFFESKLKHMSNFVLANIGIFIRSFWGFVVNVWLQRFAMVYYSKICEIEASQTLSRKKRKSSTTPCWTRTWHLVVHQGCGWTTLDPIQSGWWFMQVSV